MQVMDKLVLGSESPRRATLLRQLGLPFDVVAPDIDEAARPGELPDVYVSRMAREKADAVRQIVGPARLVLCADTTVTIDNEILGKPADEAESTAMLQRFSGSTHQVLTAVTVSHEERELHRVVETIVRFRPLTLIECQQYWRTGEPADKAGGYGIQGLGAIFVESVTGSYSNVVGLPLAETALALRQFGIDCLKSGQRE